MNLLNKAFNDSIVSDEAVNIAKDFSEIALDSILKDGLLKDIPIIGTLISLGKIVYSLKDRQTFKKIAIFLSKLQDIPLKEREKFVRKLDEDDKFKETTSEKVLLLLERLDETAKAEIIGNLFKLRVLDFLDNVSFMRFSSIVEKVFLNDLLALRQTSTFCPGHEKHHGIPPGNSFTGLLSHGLYSLEIFNRSGSNEPGLSFNKSSFGIILSNIMFYDLNDPLFLGYIKGLKSGKK